VVARRVPAGDAAAAGGRLTRTFSARVHASHGEALASPPDLHATVAARDFG
jgi:hypothetical protein